MGYRSILVHLDDSDTCEQRLTLAVTLARSFGAGLSGTYLVPTRELTPFTSAMLPDTVVAHRLHETGAAQTRAQSRFEAMAAAAHLDQARFAAPAGRAIDQAILHARYADVAVVGQPLPSDAHAAFERDLVHAILMSAGRPALVVPHFGEFADAGSTVLIAWKEARESARAVADALPFLARATRVIVLSISTPGAADARETLSDLGIAGFLAWHGIAADVRHEVAEDIDVGNLILSRVADLGVDLIVMGAYSRPRLSEVVLGGVTRHMLQAMTVPVLMSH